ncbi:MAG: hypothetical protein WCH61_05220 [bacterium]
MMMNRWLAIWVLAAAVTLVAVGCTTHRTSDTARTPEEEILLTRAADEAIGGAGDLAVYAGKKVLLETTNLECVDKPYVVDALRQALSAAGARVFDQADGKPLTAEPPAAAATAPGQAITAETAKAGTPAGGALIAAETAAEKAAAAAKPGLVPGSTADMIVTVRCGMLGTQHGETLLGLPSFKIPLPTVGTVETPEIAFFKKNRQEGRAAFSVAGYNWPDRRLVEAGCSKGVSNTHITRWTFLLLFHYTTSNVKEFE